MIDHSTHSLTLQQELEHFVENYLPALQRLEFSIVQADEHTVILSAPLSANFNDKGTAFGGSQYMLALSSAWALAYLNMVNGGEKETQFVIAEANIRYLRPTTSKRFFAQAKRSDDSLNTFVGNAHQNKRGKVKVTAEVFNEDPRDSKNRAQKTNSELEAVFALC